MYKLGLKLWSTNTTDYFLEAKRLFDQKVYEYIELYVVPNTISTLEKWKKLQIPFVIHCAHFAHGFNLAKKEKKNENLRIYNEAKIFADELNAKYIIFHGGIDGDINETAEQLASFNEARALIENKPFRALPNKMNGEFCRGYSVDEIAIVMEAAGCGFCLDVGHAICAANSLNVERYSFVRNFLSLGPKMFHLTDNTDINSEYDSHPHLGEGQLDLNKIKNMLPKGAIITLETVKNEKNKLDDFVNDTVMFKSIVT